MPDLDQLFKPAGQRAFDGQAQSWDATVVEVTGKGVMVVLPSYDAFLRWGPCLPVESGLNVGDDCAVLMTETGQPWVLRGPPSPDGGIPTPSGDLDGGQSHSGFYPISQGWGRLVDGGGI